MSRCPVCDGYLTTKGERQRLPARRGMGLVITEYVLWHCETCGTTRMLYDREVCTVDPDADPLVEVRRLMRVEAE